MPLPGEHPSADGLLKARGKLPVPGDQVSQALQCLVQANSPGHPQHQLVDAKQICTSNYTEGRYNGLSTIVAACPSMMLRLTGRQWYGLHRSLQGADRGRFPGDEGEVGGVRPAERLLKINAKA